jgi:2-C-methyl-D-erythritol 4-phosphate cytidylyltransferase/2-C-methyl-D-erythritol 2,4-cyclodiphosphate synthase
MKITLIVAAGGSGKRFKQTLTSQEASRFKDQSKMSLELLGKTVLVRSISLFDTVSEIQEVIICAPSLDVKRLRQELRGVSKHSVKVVAGGKTRAESVLRGLRYTDKNSSWIMVHDGARPLCNPEDVRTLIRSVKGYDGAILASKVTATVKETDRGSFDIHKTIDRESLYHAETPQLVKKTKLLEAYESLSESLLQTDEAGLLEQVGAKIKIVESTHWNPKITVKQDAELAEAFLQKKQKKSILKTGIGQDTHRLVKGNTFYLGAVDLKYHKGPLAHSDGDALLHAIIDGILGATAMGDIGDWFSDQKQKYKNVRSEKLLEKVLSEVSKKGWTLNHVDTVITLEKPKLGKFKRIIKENLMRLLHLEDEQVSVKAKTAEGLGPEGIGQAVTCIALVTMEKKQ